MYLAWFDWYRVVLKWRHANLDVYEKSLIIKKTMCTTPSGRDVIDVKPLKYGLLTWILGSRTSSSCSWSPWQSVLEVWREATKPGEDLDMTTIVRWSFNNTSNYMKIFHLNIWVNSYKRKHLLRFKPILFTTVFELK